MRQDDKRCTGCGEVKALARFHANRSAKDGRQHRCRDCQRESGRIRRQANRDKVLDHYGRECACCGTTKELSIDHVDGGGCGHRLELFGWDGASTRFYAWLIGQGFPPGYQVLCKRCNTSKGGTAACRLDHSADAHEASRDRLVSTESDK